MSQQPKEIFDLTESDLDKIPYADPALEGWIEDYDDVLAEEYGLNSLSKEELTKKYLKDMFELRRQRMTIVDTAKIEEDTQIVVIHVSGTFPRKEVIETFKRLYREEYGKEPKGIIFLRGPGIGKITQLSEEQMNELGWQKNQK